MKRQFTTNKGWKRPRYLVYPAKPKIGIRANKPNEIWHVDTGWTAKLIVEAAKGIKTAPENAPPQVYMDSGVENKNESVAALVAASVIQRVLAQVDIHFSNSMIESWWRQLKHQWLFLNTLDSTETVRKLVAFYVEQHNQHVPHSAFKGQTPDEMYFSAGADVPEKLLAAQLLAKQARRAANLARSCSSCRTTGQI